MEPASVGASSFQALYGSPERIHTLDLRSALKPGAFLLLAGSALGAVAAFFLRGRASFQRVPVLVVEHGRDGGSAVDGRDQLYPVLWMVFALGGLALGAYMVLSAFRDRNNRVEVRTHGLVRVSRTLGTKHFRYDAIATLEKKRDDKGRIFAVNLTTKDDTFLAVSGFAMDLDAFADDIEARRTSSILQ